MPEWLKTHKVHHIRLHGSWDQTQAGLQSWTRSSSATLRNNSNALVSCIGQSCCFTATAKLNWICMCLAIIILINLRTGQGLPGRISIFDPCQALRCFAAKLRRRSDRRAGLALIPACSSEAVTDEVSRSVAVCDVDRTVICWRGNSCSQEATERRDGQ